MASETTHGAQPTSRTFAPDAGPDAAESEPSTSQPTPPSLVQGQTIEHGRDAGRYEIVRRLDRGGMARVFLGRRLGTAGFVREVALKCMAEDWGTDEASRRAFACEARLLGLLSHHNIVQASDLVESHGRYYLVLEYVEGASLKTILRVARRDGAKLSPAFCRYVVAGVAEALHCAHELALDGKPVGIVHRDVTPANIMIALSGMVKLLDFGIAYSRLEGREHTQAGTIKGTYAYSSPEQASDDDLDGRSDLFSLGIVLVELLTQRRAFDGGSYRETIRKIRNCSASDVRAATRDVPTGLRRICRRALSRAPCDRFQSGGEFAAALREELKEHGPSYGAKECAAEVRALGAFSEHASPNKPEEQPTAPPTGRRVSGGGTLANPTRRPTRWGMRLSIAAGLLLALATAVPLLIRSPRESATPPLSPASAPEAALVEFSQQSPLPKAVTLEPERERPMSASPAPAAVTESVAPSPTPAPVTESVVPSPTPPPVAESVVRPIVRPRKKTMVAAPTSKTAPIPEHPPVAAESLPKDSRIIARLAAPIDPKKPGPVRAVVDEDVVQDNGRVIVPSGSLMACRSISSETEPTIEGYAPNARVKVRCEKIVAGNRTWLFGGYAIGQDNREGPHGLLAVGGYSVPERTPFTVYVEHER